MHCKRAPWEQQMRGQVWEALDLLTVWTQGCLRVSERRQWQKPSPRLAEQACVCLVPTQRGVGAGASMQGRFCLP